jgi:hypothetical protein
MFLLFATWSIVPATSALAQDSNDCQTNSPTTSCDNGPKKVQEPKTNDEQSSADSSTTKSSGSDETQNTGEILFDGKSLGGWTVAVFGGDGSVEVVDESIVLGVGDPLTGITIDSTDLPTCDYEISLDAQRQDGIDFFCCLTFPFLDTHASLVVGGWAGSVVGLSNIDDQNASENETTSLRSFKTGQWYHIRLRVNEQRIQAWIDDEPCVDLKTNEKKLSVHNAVSLNRPLGISSFQTKAAIKNIVLRRNVNEDGNAAEPIER